MRLTREPFQLHEVYCRVCKKQQISQISQSEFDSMCSMIDSRGIVAIKLHKERRLSRVSCRFFKMAVWFLVVFVQWQYFLFYFENLVLALQITMKIDENEVEHVLQDQSLVAAILDEETCLKR